jgi:hypothetical protein
MKPLKLTFRNVLIAALVIVVSAVAFDGFRKHHRLSTERSQTIRQTQVEPAGTSVSATTTTASI